MCVYIYIYIYIISLYYHRTCLLLTYNKSFHHWQKHRFDSHCINNDGIREDGSRFCRFYHKKRV